MVQSYTPIIDGMLKLFWNAPRKKSEICNKLVSACIVYMCFQVLIEVFVSKKFEKLENALKTSEVDTYFMYHFINVSIA